MNTISKERGNFTLTRRITRSPKSLNFTFYTINLHMTLCCLCSKVINNISRSFNLCDSQTQGYARIHFNVQYFIRMEIKLFLLCKYCIIGHLLQGSVMEQPLYKHQPRLYDVIGHRKILFLPWVWTQKRLKDVILEW